MRSGIRAGLPPALATLAVGISFGVLAQPVIGAAAAIAMSLIVYAGSAQFAAVSTLAAGGTAGAAVLAGLLMNARFLPMGIALAPSLPGRALRRAAQGQAVVDASWALSSRGDGTFDRWLLFGSTAPQYVTWTSGTVIGVLVGGVLPDAHALGLDAIFPAFFLALLLEEMKRPGGRGAAAVGALLALALVPFAPAGVPVLVASLGALLGLRRPA
jgi:4-azaleucine resistance transporter AzlC